MDANRVRAGDTVWIRDGVYNERLRITTSGNEGAWIEWKGYPGELVIIDGIGQDFSGSGYDNNQE